jgi:hypothetical protein
MLDNVEHQAATKIDRMEAPPGPYARRVTDGHALIDAGDFDAAASAAASLCQEYPQQPAGPALQARCATAARDPIAADLWRRVFERFDSRALPPWFSAYSRAMFAGGNRAEAERILRDGIARFADNAHLRYALLQFFIDTNDRAGASRELSDGIFSRDSGGSPLHRMRLQNWLGDIDAARGSFHEALAAASEIREFVQLFMAIPLNFEVFTRGELWRVLRARLSEAHSGDGGPIENCLKLRIELALRDYDGFLARYAAAPPLPAEWAQKFARLAKILRAPAFPDFTAPRVFGIGLSKTGTSSLGAALDQLGYLHAHFQNPFTNEIMTDQDFMLFDAVTDTPASLRFETLYYAFPNAKFVVTERGLEDWADSFKRHFIRSDGPGGYDTFRASTARRNQFRHGIDLAWVHAGLYFSRPDERAAWHAYNARVSGFFANKPHGKLLRHNVFEGDGWPELCTFLNRAMPATPYPWSNRGNSPGD